MENQNKPTQNEIETEESLTVLQARKHHVEKRLEGFQFKGWILSLFAIAGGLISYAFKASSTLYGELTIEKVIPFIIIGICAGAFLYFYFTFSFRLANQSALRRIDFRIAQLGGDKLKENIEENFFTKLVQINFKYLDQYYLQTQEQADKSFRLASFASISGLAIIVIGILMMLFNKTEPAYVTTSAGILSEFIAAIFFYLYNKTILKMSEYHQKLVITQNVSLALKITDEMEKEQKAKSLELLIDRLTTDINKHLTGSKP